MQQVRSIRSRLSLALIQLFVLIVALASVGLWRLIDYHRMAAELDDRYLPATQYLGDLSNLTSESRALEASGLLAVTDPERRIDRAELDEVDRRIAKAIAGYTALPLPEELLAFFTDFTEKWSAYRVTAERVLALATSNSAEATSLFRNGARHDYDKAADALWTLGERNRIEATEASRRTQRSYDQALWLSVAGLLLGGVILIGGVLHIRRAILTPLARLAAAMRRLAANDTEIGRLETGRPDEIGQMAHAVDIFRQSAVSLNEKLAQEQRLAELQRNFVAMASHEFRTPLTVIDGHAQRLIDRLGKAETDEIGERAGKIRQAVTRMAGVIGTLIDSARLIDAPAGDFSRFDFAKAMREVCQLYRDMAPHARIVETIPERELPMKGDPKLIFQLFSNLLSNAAKYSPADGEIRVEVERQGGVLMASVADQGMGIPAADRERLFDRYYRGSNVAGTVGTGIGLHLVRIVLDLHGGDIAVESQEGRGSRFIVTLPTCD